MYIVYMCILFYTNLMEDFLFFLDFTMPIQVQCTPKRHIVILFQPVKLTCNYDTSSTKPPIVTWKYKSYCQDPIKAAMNPGSTESIAQSNPSYDPNIECSDSQRSVRSVASKQGGAVSFGKEYVGRKMSIINSELSCYMFMCTLKFILGYCWSGVGIN